MSEHILIASGFGGQGVMLMGQVLANAAMVEGKYSTWLPSYGPEMRGGTAYCTVVISDEPIASPITDSPNEMIVMNIPSLLKFEPTITEKGLMILNSSVVDRDGERSDLDIAKVDANKIAEELGNMKVSNMVVLGSYLGKTEAVSVESVRKALEKKLVGKKAALIDLNMKAVMKGIEAVK